MKKFFKEYWFVFLAAVICISILASGFKVVVTVGESMMPTLKSGQLLIMTTRPKEIERYDIIVFSADNADKTDAKTLIKRVIGLPGEKIQIIDNDIYINDKKIKDSVDIKMEKYGVLEEGIILKENEYFAMGDNRNHSYDCRMFGPVKVQDIKGKALSHLMNDIDTISCHSRIK